MTEVEIYQPPAAPAVPVTAAMDSWIAVCSDVIKVANVICDTPFVPDGLRGSGPAVAAAILTGRELSLGPMTSLANIHVIKGKPALSAVLMRALVQAQGHQWQDGDVTDTRAVVRGRRRGEAEWTEVAFTADQARKAGIDLGKYPQDKLYARATSRLARRKFADVIAGMPYSAEELEDGDEQRSGPQANGTAPPPPAPAPRTAQRRQRAAKPEDPAPAASAATSAHTGAPVSEESAPSDPALPPLPGEESEPQPDFDPDARGTSTRGTGGQLTALWTVLNTVYDFAGTEEGKDDARKAVEALVGRALDGGTTGDLSFNEARGVLDSLALVTAEAQKQGITPREQLIVFLTKIDEAAGGDDA